MSVYSEVPDSIDIGVSVGHLIPVDLYGDSIFVWETAVTRRRFKNLRIPAKTSYEFPNMFVVSRLFVPVSTFFTGFRESPADRSVSAGRVLTAVRNLLSQQTKTSKKADKNGDSIAVRTNLTTPKTVLNQPEA